MIRVTGSSDSVRALGAALRRLVVRVGVVVGAALLFYALLTARVGPTEFGVEQVRFGLKTGIRDRVYGPGLYFVPPGTTMHTFPRTIHVLEATYDKQEAGSKARNPAAVARLERYFAQRDRLLGATVHRVVEALNVQTSDGYAVTTDITLLYTIDDPVRIARDFGWGAIYIDSFVINTFRNSVLTTLGKINAESFYDPTRRIEAVAEAEELLRQRFGERGFRVETLLLRNYRYADAYESALSSKKVAVQQTEKNRKLGLVNEEKAKLQQIESRGNATITIAESEANARIARIRAEAELYSSQTRARADTEVNIAQAEAKRLKAEALTQAGGRYVVALETAKMFDSIDGAVMTPEQYIGFIRSVWALIGIRSGTAEGGKP
jgi:regulator of protease activity HflC (stomatin/prohibitin superfamily)